MPRNRTIAAIAGILALIAFVAIVRPRSASPIVGSLRVATATEAAEARDAMELDPEGWQWGKKAQTYVAAADFHTTFTTRPVVIMVPPGIKWLGGSLGDTTLVMRITDEGYHRYWNQSPKTYKMVQQYGWAHVVYDPLCRAYAMGLATASACHSTMQERSQIAKPTLTAMTPSQVKEFVGSNSIGVQHGRHTTLQWLTPQGTSSTVRPSSFAQRAPGGNDWLETAIALRAGQQLAGGELGATVVVGYQTLNDGALTRHQLVRDPVPLLCIAGTDDDIRSYLGPEVIARYKDFCVS